LLAGQHLAGQAGANQAGLSQVATLAPSSPAVQPRPLLPSLPNAAQHRSTSPPSSTGISPQPPHSTATSTRSSPPSSTGSSPQQQQHSTATSPLTSHAAARAIAFALAQQGKPYQWGGESPDADDCSGLVWRAWRHAGLDWVRMSAAGQWQWLHQGGHDVPATQMGPGDPLFYADNPHDPASIHHVAMAIGHGRMVEAPERGLPVRVRPLRLRDLHAAAQPP
jgi:cell wall-associated NlpC family hydrolase